VNTMVAVVIFKVHIATILEYEVVEEDVLC